MDEDIIINEVLDSFISKATARGIDVYRHEPIPKEIPFDDEDE